QVDGHPITRTEWEQQHRTEVDRIRQQAPTLDASMFDTDAARYDTLQRMVRDRVLHAAVVQNHMGASEARLHEIFANDPGIKSFVVTKNGKAEFDVESFMRVTGRTPEQHTAALGAELAQQQVLAGVSASSFAPQAYSDETLKALYERREVQVARFDPTR